MLRDDHTRAVKFVGHAKRRIGLGQLARGHLEMDAAGFVGSGYAHVDEDRVGTAMGFMIIMEEDLADNHIDYIDVLGATQHTTLLIAINGAFTTIDDTYTEAGLCTTMLDAGGELINITGSTEHENNGTFLSTGGDDNTVILAPLPGESVDIVDEAAVATAVMI